MVLLLEYVEKKISEKRRVTQRVKVHYAKDIWTYQPTKGLPFSAILKYVTYEDSH